VVKILNIHFYHGSAHQNAIKGLLFVLSLGEFYASFAGFVQ